jgi:acetolactate synthase-1/2/3 large subunit
MLKACVSTQPVYAGNLFYDHDRAGGWFNSATGYGALGYAIPAAIGAAIARPDLPVLCLTGDGGAQFSLSELMTAAQEALPVTFVIWNNRGYGEIAASMRDAGATVIGCDPAPPDFADLARACGMPYATIAADPSAIAEALRRLRASPGPSILEIRVADAA